MDKETSRQGRVCPCLLVYLLLVSLLGGLQGEPTPNFTIALAGDVMLGRGVAQALEGDWASAFAAVRPWLATADCAFANLESPLTTAPQLSDGYDLRAPPAAVAALQAAGFDVLSLANNHALDAGVPGLQETVATLQAAGITPLYQSTNSQSTNYQSTTYQLLAFDDSVVPLDIEAVSEAVSAAARESAGVVVSIHWGGEYQAAPSPRQRALARALADAGADVIVGHGPHVLQRMEWIGETLVAYSLGNLLFDQPYPADCRQGAILRVTLRGGRVVAFEAVPTVAERGRVVLAGPRDATAIYERLHLTTNQQTH